MKRGVALILAGVASVTAAASDPYPAVPPGVVDVTPAELPPAVSVPAHCECDPPMRSLFLSAEYLLLLPRRGHTDIALADAGNDLVPIGRTEELPYDWSSGLRVSGGWRPAGSVIDFAAGYTYLDAGDGRQLASPAGGSLYATRTRPGTIDAVATASADAQLNYHVVDLETGRTFAADRHGTFRLFGGVRIAAIDQDFNTFYDGGDANSASVRQRIDFSGAGLVGGGEGKWRLGRQLSLFGKARGSLVAGDYTLRHRETDFAGGVVNADVHEQFDRVVPVIELGGGLTWEYRSYHASVGYEMINWISQTETISFIDDFSEGRFHRRSSNLSLDGVSFKFGVNY